MGKTGLLTLGSAVLLRKKKTSFFWWLHMACHSFWWWCKKAERWQEILQQWKLVGSLPSYKKALWREKNTCGDCTLSNFPILFRNLYQASRLRLFSPWLVLTIHEIGLMVMVGGGGIYNALLIFVVMVLWLSFWVISAFSFRMKFMCTCTTTQCTTSNNNKADKNRTLCAIIRSRKDFG